MAEIIRHDPIDIAVRAAEASVVARNGIIYVKVFFGDDGDGLGATSAVMYEITAGGSARILNDGCEAVIEDGMITGYRRLAPEKVSA